MGKNKRSSKKTKHRSVFKVVGARSLKSKTKAKQVTGDLKKLNTARNLAAIDRQLNELREELRVEETLERWNNSEDMQEVFQDLFQLQSELISKKKKKEVAPKEDNTVNVNTQKRLSDKDKEDLLKELLTMMK